MFNEIDDILNFNNAAQQQKPQHKIEDKPAVEVLVDSLTTQSKNTNELKMLSFNLTKQLDIDIKAAAKRTGKTLKSIVNTQLERLFNEKLELVNEAEVGESVLRQVRIDAHLAKQLDEYVAEQGVSKRFVIEALLSEYVSRYKKI